ncbi:AtpZ/AtpI family protein [bacterium]|nr:AtpZ/AtpI family protein [bacterium]
MTLGIQFVATILVCVFAGRWVDGRYDMAPIFTLVGGFLGIAAGFYHFLKTKNTAAIIRTNPTI